MQCYLYMKTRNKHCGTSKFGWLVGCCHETPSALKNATSTTKLFFCHKLVLDMYLMNLFIWRKNDASLSKYLDFCFCEICKFQNLWRHHRHCCIMKVAVMLFFWILSTIKMKFGQILVCSMTNISNMFLAQCCRLEASSRPFII